MMNIGRVLILLAAATMLSLQPASAMTSYAGVTLSQLALKVANRVAEVLDHQRINPRSVSIGDFEFEGKIVAVFFGQAFANSGLRSVIQ